MQDFTENIKTSCVGVDCKRELPGTFYYYNMHGNFCKKCLSMVEKRLAGYDITANATKITYQPSK